MRNVSKHIGFIFLVMVLGVVYISNAHKAERKLRKINELQKSVEDAKSLYQEVKSQNTYGGTESQLVEKLKSQGFTVNSQSLIVLKEEQ